MTESLEYEIRMETTVNPNRPDRDERTRKGRGCVGNAVHTGRGEVDEVAGSAGAMQRGRRGRYGWPTTNQIWQDAACGWRLPSLTSGLALGKNGRRRSRSPGAGEELTAAVAG